MTFKSNFIDSVVEPGAHIIDVLCESQVYADYCSVPVRFEFNGAVVIVFPGKRVSESYITYMSLVGDVGGTIKK